MFFGRLDVYNFKDDAAAFVGKRALISFLSWLDYCDQLIKEAQKVIVTGTQTNSELTIRSFQSCSVCVHVCLSLFYAFLLLSVLNP